MRFITLIALTVVLSLVHLGEVQAQTGKRPDRRLLKTEIWERVSNNRFEDKYLYLAVIWRGDKYVLLDMGMEDKVLLSSEVYKDVHKAIRKLSKNRYKPHQRLRIKDKWNRVAMYRFECNPLKIMVEWEGGEYILFAVSGEKKELIRSKDFMEIERVIENYTITNSF